MLFPKLGLTSFSYTEPLRTQSLLDIPTWDPPVMLWEAQDIMERLSIGILSELPANSQDQLLAGYSSCLSLQVKCRNLTTFNLFLLCCSFHMYNIYLCTKPYLTMLQFFLFTIIHILEFKKRKIVEYIYSGIYPFYFFFFPPGVSSFFLVSFPFWQVYWK